MNKDSIIRAGYHAIIIFAGFISLSLELLTSRALVPHVGTSVHIWGALLVVSLLVIALGYAFGEYSSVHIAPDKKPMVFVRRGLIASFFVLFASFFQYSANIYFQSFPQLVSAMFGTFFILGPCLFLTSSMTPLLISMELYLKQQSKIQIQSDSSVDHKLGDGNAGMVLAEGTVGAVLGAFVCSYVILPNMAVDTALAVIVLPLLISSLTVSFLHKRYIRPSIRRMAVIACVASVGIAYLNSNIQARASIQLGQIQVAQIEVAYTPYGTIRILEVPERDVLPKEKYWLMDGSTQNVMLETGQHRTAYTNAIVNLLTSYETKPDDILLLGGGAGLIARDLYLAGRTVDVVDIIPDSKRLAQTHFNLPKSVPYIIKDARVFLNTCEEKYDAIIYDLYGAFTVPDNAFTAEAFEAAEECLNPEGLLIINTLRMPGYTEPDSILHATLREVFPYIDFYTIRHENLAMVNGLWIASKDSVRPVRFFGGNEPDYVQKQLEDYWHYKKPPAPTRVSKDALPLYNLAMQPVMDYERKMAFIVYGPAVMHP